MSTVVIILAIILAGSAVAASLLWYAIRHRPPFSRSLPFITTPHRKMSAAERAAVERYLSALARQRSNPIPSGASSSPQQLALSSQSNNVYPLTRAITRYGLSTDEPHKWRYFLDEVEVHLPAQWEQYIAEENYVELIKTQSVPLIITLNGHALTEYSAEPPMFSSALRVSGQNASIRQEEGENVELLGVRKESPEEFALNRPDGTREAMVISLALLLFFFALTGPQVLMPWLVMAGVSMVLVSGWFLYRPPASKALREIHCLRGTPKRWGLFGESNQGQASSVSLGSFDLIYPPHWQNYVSRDLGQTTEIDIYLNRQVVKQGRFLSLQDEVRNFPLRRWRKNVVLAAGSLLVLALMVSWVPLSMPWKISLAWLKGTESLQVSRVSELEKASLRVGDSLKVKGTGMCSVPAIYQGNRSYPFMPFDCSAMYWNTAVPLPVPQSEVIDRATALVDALGQQLHPQTDGDAKLNPQLASAIQKAGMILLDDFSDIVLKTQALCSQEQDCVRLKNALVNLGSAKDWPTLVRRADSGALNGTNVILRPVSADALENLVNTATATFFYRETRRAAEALNSPPPGGFLLISDEGRQLVNHPAPSVSLFDYNAPDQWPALQRLAGMMLHTPFSVSGIVTGMTTDANGTRHVVLHSEPDSITLWRYLGTSLLLLVLLISVALNALLALLRIRRNRQRLLAIRHYYDKCFSHSLDDIKAIRPL